MDILENQRTDLELFIINRLIQLMEEKNLSRYKLSKLTGVTQASVSTILSGKCAPSISTVEKICNGLGISVSDFFKTEDSAEYHVSSEEIKTLKLWNILDPVQKKMVYTFAEGMLTQKNIKSL